MRVGNLTAVLFLKNSSNLCLKCDERQGLVYKPVSIIYNIFPNLNYFIFGRESIPISLEFSNREDSESKHKRLKKSHCVFIENVDISRFFVELRYSFS